MEQLDTWTYIGLAIATSIALVGLYRDIAKADERMNR